MLKQIIGKYFDQFVDSKITNRRNLTFLYKEAIFGSKLESE